jgi:uroporphyrinogen-III synthase
LLERGVPGRVLLLRALTARDALPHALAAAGVHVDVVPAYQTLDLGEAKRSELSALITGGGVDVVMLTASSTVRAFVAALDERAKSALDSVVIACIGPITRDTALELGLRAEVVAESFTLDGVLDALERRFADLAPT